MEHNSPVLQPGHDAAQKMSGASCWKCAALSLANPEV